MSQPALPTIRLSPAFLSDPVWKFLFQSDDERGPAKAALAARLAPLETLRGQADYNTGSISFAAAWSLYAAVRHFRPQRILEIGTFIGRSTTAMGAALDDAGVAGEIATCDLSNDLTLPWSGAVRLEQFRKTSSTDMLRQLDGLFDFVFLDGRLTPADMPLLDGLIGPNTVIALDDFEGKEKGVANLMALRSLAAPKLARHGLIYPPTQALLSAQGFTSSALTALMIPYSAFAFVNQ